MSAWKDATAPGKVITRQALLERLRELLHASGAVADFDGIDEAESLLLRYIHDTEVTVAYMALVHKGVI